MVQSETFFKPGKQYFSANSGYFNSKKKRRVHRLCLRELLKCSVNHLSGGGVNANHNATHSPSLAPKKQN